MGGKSSSSNQLNWSQGSETTTPWSAQAPYLEGAFGRAEGAYQDTMDRGPYMGDYVAQGDGRNEAAFNQAYGFGTDPRNTGYVQNQLNTSNNMMNSGSQWMERGATGLEGLSGDQTQNIINSAGQYADNPYIAGAIRAAMADANRQASESTIPNLYRSAAGSNALNSDRAALSQGVVERGLAEQAGNLSAQMRYDAYGRGINTAQNELNARRGAFGTLGQMGQGAAGLGMEGLGQGIANQSRLNQMSAAGAEGLRGLRQDKLDNDMARFEGQTNFPWAALNNFYNIIGNKSWGGTRNWSQVGGQQSEARQNPSTLETVGSGVSVLGSVLGGGRSGGGNSNFQFL
jgi:hypothetical protein